MGTTVLGYPDKTLSASLSGGSWQLTSDGDNSLLNLKNPLLSKKAISTNAFSTSTVVVVDMLVSTTINVAAILAHNLTYSAAVKIAGYSDSGCTVFVGGDSSLTSAVPQTLGSTYGVLFPNNYIRYFSTAITARYWKIEINDPSNTYVELGRLWLGPVLDLGMIIEYDASLTYQSRDILEMSIGGVTWGTKETPMRKFVGNISGLSSANKQKMLLTQKELGTYGEFLWIPNYSASLADMILESFPARFSEISALTYPYFNGYGVGISCQEII